MKTAFYKRAISLAVCTILAITTVFAATTVDANAKSKSLKSQINSIKLKPMLTHKKSFDNKVKALLGEILKGKTTNYDKLKAIYRWTYKNITYKWPKYGYKAYPYLSNRDRTTVIQAERTLRLRYGTCNDYSNLFNVLARRVGFDVYTVDSYAHWGGQDGGHSWNMVRVGSKWYRVDTQIQKLKSPKRTDYTFFMQSDRTDWGVTYPKVKTKKLVKEFKAFKLKGGRKVI